MPRTYRGTAAAGTEPATSSLSQPPPPPSPPLTPPRALPTPPPTDPAPNTEPVPSPSPCLPPPPTFPSLSSAASPPPPPLPLPSPPLPASAGASPSSSSVDDFPDWHGRFTVLRRLGYGAFSTVWLAHDRERPSSHPHYTVALKRLKPLSTATRLYDEARFIHALGGQQHVVELLEILVDRHDHRSHPTLVLSYTPHSAYKSYLRSLTLRQVQLYLSALLSAFAHLHSQPQPILHRDLKPANFLYQHPPSAAATTRWLEQGDTRGLFALVDFGLAHAQHDSARRDKERAMERKRREREQSAAEPSPPPAKQRKAASLPLSSPFSASASAVSSLPPLPEASTLGTRGFRAPEILLRQPRRVLSTSLDVWNVGVILLSILCQRYPVFDRSNSEEALVQIAMLLGDIGQVGDTRVEYNGIDLRKAGEDYDTASSAATRFGPAPSPPLPTPSDYPSLDEFCWLSCERHWPADAFDLLRRLLCFDPHERVTAAEALQHPFLVTDYDDRGKAWEERKRSAEANELRWQQRKERREQRWKRKEKARRTGMLGVANEKENVHNGGGATSRAWSAVLQQQSERTTFTSRAELGLAEVREESSSATASHAACSAFVLPSATKRLR